MISSSIKRSVVAVQAMFDGERAPRKRRSLMFFAIDRGKAPLSPADCAKLVEGVCYLIARSGRPEPAALLELRQLYYELAQASSGPAGAGRK